MYIFILFYICDRIHEKYIRKGRIRRLKKFLGTAEIIQHEIILPTIRRMVVAAPEIAATAVPGQFVNIHYTGGGTFLRRPFGIVAAKNGHITIIYRIVGKGTEEMSRLTVGDVLSIEGPLGEGVFTVSDMPTLLAGGGVGLAPLIFLAAQSLEPIVLIAGKTAVETKCWVPFFAPYAKKIYMTTDDGSAGIKGMATAALDEIFSHHLLQRIAVCGPTPMMKSVAQAAAVKKISCEVSLEKRMACGIGVCLGCTGEYKNRDGRYKVCADGPVFAAEEVFA